MTIKTYKNGKVVLKEDGIKIWISPKDHPQVHLFDDLNRYGYYVYRGISLCDNPTIEIRTELVKEILIQYKTVRGQRTSWTVDDAWLKKWKARNGKEIDPPVPVKPDVKGKNK